MPVSRSVMHDRSETFIGGSVVETKQQILKAIEELPDDAAVEDAMDRLYVFVKPNVAS